MVEKYLQLARDATTAGESINAENYFQHAEHYSRVYAASNSGNDNGQGPRSQDETESEAPGDAPNGAGNGADLKAKGTSGADATEQPEINQPREPDSAQGANGTDNTDGPTQDAG